MNYQANPTDSDFEASGLSRLTTVNWQDEHHRRSITASLVQGVYELEHARQKNFQECKAWWEFFDYQLLDKLTDNIYSDSSIFGAIYEFTPKARNNYSIEAPTYVIAFRGTIMERHSFVRDMKLNIKILKNKLHRTSCIEKAIQAVKDKASIHGATIWLAGHSLGSAIAMFAGKDMAKTGKFLTSYLFNPPFVAFPMKRGILVAGTFMITAALTVFIRDHEERQHSENRFKELRNWVPKLYLHESDPICTGYIRYFKLLERMQRYGVGVIGRLAAQNSLKGLFMEYFGMEYCSEELHLIPSACVTTSCTPKRHAHDLSQWFRDDSVSDPKMYCYNNAEETV
ncbi:hypothetical protein MKW98_012744 [Papaver atlanticum]|uniref:Fungal lipase-type domain-containing protein n=1 Tax=Papaver atlanticum TaxID=357466 RepID=A0AAD4T3W3_9MAGN|nr:hypothetical protein MKW98_012744 [Papaver atlanticum]